MKPIFLTVLVVLLFGCKDEPVPTQQKPISEISTDQTFKEFREIDTELASQTDIQALQSIIADNKISPAEQAGIHKVFGFASEKEFVDVMQGQMDRKQILNERYNLSSLNKDQQLQLFQTALTPKEKTGNQIKDAFVTCEQTKMNCFVSVAANSLALHFSCSPLDVTFWAGLVCHSAVIIYNYTENNRCNYEYQYCLEQLKRNIQ